MASTIGGFEAFSRPSAWEQFGGASEMAHGPLQPRSTVREGLPGSTGTLRGSRHRSAVWTAATYVPTRPCPAGAWAAAGPSPSPRPSVRSSRWAVSPDGDPAARSQLLYRYRRCGPISALSRAGRDPVARAASVTSGCVAVAGPGAQHRGAHGHAACHGDGVGGAERGSWDAEPAHPCLQPRPAHLEFGAQAPHRPALPDPPRPQVRLQIGKSQRGQARLPRGCPAGGTPRSGPVVPGGWSLAAQPVLVEPVGHGGRVHAKLPREPQQRPRPRGDPVGQVCLKGREAELGGSPGELLVGGAAALVGSSRRRGWGWRPA